MLITAQLSRISLIYRLLRDAEAAFLSLEIAGDLPPLLCVLAELMSFEKRTCGDNWKKKGRDEVVEGEGGWLI